MLIDKAIAPVIQHLWDMGVTTLASCEAYSDGRGRILFGSADDLEMAHHALHDLSCDDVKPHALMHARTDADWTVSAWAKLWFSTPPESTERLDGPTSLYYELAMPADHLTQIAQTLHSNSTVEHE